MKTKRKPILPSTDDLLAALGGSLEPWAQQCHAASVRLVNSDVFGDAFARVARGSCRGVFGQHSWVVVGRDCYADNAVIIDPTLWSYDKTVDGIWTGTARDKRHTPKGKGSIWAYGRPEYPTGEIITLTPAKPFSPAADEFLCTLGPLDRRGWMQLASCCPVQGWPAGEIFEAMQDSGLGAYVPIDLLGMCTDLNPQGLYLKTAAQ
jgi:hypothetical protein